MPDGVPPAVAKSFAALIPAILTLSVFLVINAIMVGVFNANLHDVIYEVIQKPLTGLGGSLPATLIALFFVQFLWFFGLHGQIIVNSVMDPIWNTLMLDKKKQYKDIGRLALGPGVFNVNEPVIFGLPIVLNATILIPWVLAPLVVTTLNYLVMAAGIVPAPTGVSVPWTVPIIASGVLATNSWLGGLLQVVDFVIVALIWFPFLKALDREVETDI